MYTLGHVHTGVGDGSFKTVFKSQEGFIIQGIIENIKKLEL